MPRCRWIITKTDLLALRAIGYRLRETSAFQALAIVTKDLPAGAVGRPLEARLTAEGGTPAYCWDVVEGKLPTDLVLDSLHRADCRAPVQAGEFMFTVRVRDSEVPSAERRRTIRMRVK